MSQTLLIISSIMSLVMLVVVGLLLRKKALLRDAHLLSRILAGGSFGAFFVILVLTAINYGRASYYSDSLILGGLILGFLLALAAGSVFLSQRARGS